MSRTQANANFILGCISISSDQYDDDDDDDDDRNTNGRCMLIPRKDLGFVAHGESCTLHREALCANCVVDFWYSYYVVSVAGERPSGKMHLPRAVPHDPGL